MRWTNSRGRGLTRRAGRSGSLCAVVATGRAVLSPRPFPAGQAKLAVLNSRTPPDAPQDIDRRPTRMEAVATKTAGFAIFLSITS
jgi:hypothetical protein